MICAITPSSVMEVNPWPTRPASVSISTRQPDMAAGRDAPTSVMLSGTLTGVVVIFAIFMS